MNDISKEQIEALEEGLRGRESVAVSMFMTTFGFDFIVSQLRILNKAKYKEEQGITLVDKHSTLGKYQCRIIYSDNSSKVINLREER